MSNDDELFNFAYGWNGYGQVGTTGTHPQVNEPERLELQTDDDEAADDYEMEPAKDGVGEVEYSPFAVVDVAAGPFHSAAVDAGGRVWTWGNGRDGQLGHSLGVENTSSYFDALENAEERVPRCLRLPGVRFSLVACGTSHTLALTRGGAVFGWGSNSQGQLGIEAHSTASNNSGIVVHPEPIPDTFGVVLVAAGGEFSCAIVEVSCSTPGGGKYFEPESEELPVAALGARRADAESGSPPPPAPKRRKRLLTWGSNEFGQLGRIPVRTCPWTHVPGDAGLDGPTDVACGLDHVIALASGGALYAAGRGNDGQLGSGKRQPAAAFTRLEAPLLQGHGPFCKVGAGMSSSAAVSYDGRLYTWGDNSSFQLGFGDDELRLEPTPTAIAGCVDVGIGDECCVCVVEDAAGQAKLFSVGHSGGGRLGIGDVPFKLTTRAAIRMQSFGRRCLASQRVAAKRRALVESVVASLVDAAVRHWASAAGRSAEGDAMVSSEEDQQESGGPAPGGQNGGENKEEGDPLQVVDGAVMYWDDLGPEGGSYDGDEAEGEEEQDNEDDDRGNDHPRLVKAPTGSELTASFYHQIVSCFHDDAWPPIKTFEPVAIPDESWHSVLRLRKLAVGGCHVIGCGWLTMRDDGAAAAGAHVPPSSKSRAGWYASLQFRKCCNATCDVTFPEPLIDLHEMICKAVDEGPSMGDADPSPKEEGAGAAEEPPDLAENAENAAESAAADSPTPDPEGHSDSAEALPAAPEAEVQEGPAEEEAVDEGEPEPAMKVIRKRVGGGWKNILVPDTDAAGSGSGSGSGSSGSSRAALSSSSSSSSSSSAFSGGGRGGGAGARPRQQPVAGSAVGAARALRDT